MELPNIKYNGNISKDILVDDDEYARLSYFKSIDDFEYESDYSKFIKAVELTVRTNNDYKAFLAYIKNTLGLNFSQVFSKIYDKVDATIEFHHGPIFTLYDICENELTKYIKTGARINTFRLADSVLDLHYQMKVNGVLLSKTDHEMAHNGDIFLNVNQSIGDVNAYIREYAKYFNSETKYKLYTYIQMCKDNPSFDRGVLDMDVVKEYIKPSAGE